MSTAGAVDEDAGRTAIWLIRHGATVQYASASAVPLTDGRFDPPLSRIGNEQAKRLTARLQGRRFDALFASGLERTLQTLKPLVSNGSHGEVRIVPNLREVYLGDWEDGGFARRLVEGHPLALQAVAEQSWGVVPGAESGAEFAERVRKGMYHAVSQVPWGSTIAVVAHAAVIGELCAQATGSSPFAFIWNHNVGISRMGVDRDGTLHLESFNDTAHLDYS